MIFDKAAKALLTMGNEHTEALLKEAQLFHYPYDAATTLKKSLTDDEHDYVTNDFILPFHTVAVEDPDGVVFLSDPKGEVPRGMGAERSFLNFSTVEPSVYLIMYGKISIQPGADNNKLFVHLILNGWDVLPRTKQYSKYEIDQAKQHMTLEALKEDASSAAKTALEELATINTSKDKFILERKPAKKRNSKGVARSHQRSVYTLLSIAAIQDTLKVDPTKRQSLKEGHCRRRHYRELAHERFTKNADGSNRKLLIDAMWVGPDSYETKQHHYKVRLDL